MYSPQDLSRLKLQKLQSLLPPPPPPPHVSKRAAAF